MEELAAFAVRQREEPLFYEVALCAAEGGEYNNTIQAIQGGKSPSEAFKTLKVFAQAN